ncbi:Splicing factor [Coemansia nantahalensis]|nr:Splicing factor [Coemansia nantahalensis]
MSTADMDAWSDLDAFLEALPEKLEKSPYDHGVYTQWVALMQAIGNVESLRDAQERMCSQVAVPEETLLGWIADEEARLEANCDEATLASIVRLFEAGVQDRRSPSMWQRYADAVLRMADSDDAAMQAAAAAVFGAEDYSQGVLLRAVEATRANYQHGQAIWVLYKDRIARDIDQASEPQRGALVELLHTALLDRLCQPHAGLDDTWSLYSEYTTRYHNADYEQQMVAANEIVANTRRLCAQREALEDRLVAAGYGWGAFSEYIDRLVQQKGASVEEVAALYEQALLHNGYSPEAWSEYTAYLEGVAGNTSAVLAVSERAIRSCPWSGKLWAQAIHFSYMVHGRESAGEVFRRAQTTHAIDYSMLEYGHAAVAWLTAVRLDSTSSPEAAEMLPATCEECIDTAYSLEIGTADPYLFLERCCTSVVVELEGGPEVARKIWTRVCKARKVCTEAWVLSAEFERAHGTAASARSVYRHAAQRKLDNPERLFDTWLAFECAAGELAELYAAERVVSAQRRVAQRRLEREACHVGASDTQPEGPPEEAEQAEAEQAEAEQTEGPAAKRRRADSPAEATRRSDGSLVVFAKGFPLGYGASDIEAFFGGGANVGQATVLAAKQGAACGQAKVVLRTTDALVAALDKNGSKIDGQFVSVHTFKKQRPARAATAEISVEVRGFSPETSNKQIEAIARGAGTLVRVRRSQAGDVAYAVMKSREDALRAVGLLNGSEIGGKTLTAAIGPGTGTGAGASADAGAATKMMPRRVAARGPAKKVRLRTQQPATPASEAGDVGKTNADFRQLYLGTK